MNLTGLFRRYILKNWTAKLLCLLLAFGFWAWVAVQDRDTRSFRAAVQFTDLPESSTVSGQTTRDVTVTARGPGTVLGQLDDDDFTVQVSLEEFDLEEAEGYVRIYDWDVSHPRGLEVTEVEPEELRVVLEPKATRELPVEVKTGAFHREEYELNKQVTPSTAVLTGPEEEIENLEVVRLEELSWPSPREAVRREQVEAAVDPAMEVEYPEAGLFTVELRVEEPSKTRSFEQLPVKVVDVPEGMRAEVEPEKISFRVQGEAELIEELTPEDIEVIVTAPATPGLSIENASVELPGGVDPADDYQLQKSVKVELIEDG